MNVRSLLSRRKWNYTSRQSRVVQVSLKYSGIVALLISMAMLLLSACTTPWTAPVRSGTPEPGAGYGDTPTVGASPTTQATKVPNITFHITGCPSTLSVNWDKLLGTKPGVNKV